MKIKISHGPEKDTPAPFLPLFCSPNVLPAFM